VAVAVLGESLSEVIRRATAAETWMTEGQSYLERQAEVKRLPVKK